MKNYCAVGERYVEGVIDGTILACRWVRLACQRHRQDVQDSLQDDWPYRFDVSAANKAMHFTEGFRHVKGKWARNHESFKLEPWQIFTVMSIFGWVHKQTGLRRFRRAMLMVPRKNGKSILAALIGLRMFAADGEHGAEVYSGATSEKQAWEVFRPARLMAAQEPEFLEGCGVQVMKSNLHILSTGSRFEPVIGKPGDGAMPSCAIVDEYHEHATSELFDTLTTGQVGREQPLTLIISTAGDNLGGPCHALQLDLQKVLEGVIQDDTFWGIVYTIDADDDWATEAALIKANPNYGVSVDAELLKAAQREAIRTSRMQGVFQTKHLNVWVGARSAFFNIKRWNEAPRISIEDCKGFPLYGGIDLASTTDIAALALLFKLDEKRYAAFGRYYVPDARIHQAVNAHYKGWQIDGHLIATPGGMIDYRMIEADVLEIHERYGFRGLAFDPAYAQMLSQRLDVQMGAGICINVRPQVTAFSEPMKFLDGLIQAGGLEHDHNPAMSWMMSNVVAKMDNKDNVYPNKEKPESKIDGPVSLIMATNLALAEKTAYVEPQFFVLGE
jgi:phage terminase large subunit-like protein